MEKFEKKRLLITGISGLLGYNLAYCLKDQYDILGLYLNHSCFLEGIQTQKVDLFDAKKLKEVVQDFDASVLIHSAAISDVDLCERDQDLAFRTNVVGTQNIVNAIDGMDTRLIYISTDLVYSAENGSPLTEETPIDPANQYGQTKYQGELEALKKDQALVLRTNFFGWNFQNKDSLAEWIIHELKNHRHIKGFKDVSFSAIYTFHFAHILNHIIKSNLSGVYNLGSRTHMTKYEFASKLAEKFYLDKSLIEKTSIDDFELDAERRKFLALDVSKIERDLGVTMPTMEEAIESFYKDFKQNIVRKIKPAIYPTLDVIPYGRQVIDETDIASVVDVLKSQSVTQGPKVEEFEGVLAEVTDARYSVAVNSGTSALHIACLAAGIGRGDEVITSTNSFVASANCIVYCQGTPVFADIDAQTHNISPSEIERKITKRTKAVIPVHFAGQSCDMEAIQNIVRKNEKKYGHKIHIIEDASHALGSKFKGKKIGSGVYGDMTIMSFHPVKHITTGEGGVVLTNDEELYQKLKRFRSHGITSVPEEFVYKNNAFDDREKKNPWYYEQQCLGYNYRITDIQCALGVSQLKKLEIFRKRRREIVDYYNDAFKDTQNITIPFELEYCDSNFHLYILLFEFEKIGITRSELMMKLRENSILTQVHYIPVHTQPFYQQKFNTKWGDCLTAESYYQRCLSLPLYPSMMDEDVEKVIGMIKNEVKK